MLVVVRACHRRSRHPNYSQWRRDRRVAADSAAALPTNPQLLRGFQPRWCSAFGSISADVVAAGGEGGEGVAVVVAAADCRLDWSNVMEGQSIVGCSGTRRAGLEVDSPS